MNVLGLIIYRMRYRRAVVLPRNDITHSEPSKFIPGRLSPAFFNHFLLFFALLLFFTQTPSRANQSIYPASTQSNALDNMNEFARSAAMGSAFTGVADDASALFINPAGLGFLNQVQLFLNSDFWLVGTLQETALGGFPIEGLGGFALAVHYLDYGLMDGRDELGSVTADYSADRLGLQAGWGYEFWRNFFLGIGVNGTQTNLAGTGYASISSNLGILWKDPGGFGLGASYVNAGWISPGGISEDAVNLGASLEMPLDSTSRLLTAAGGTIEPSAVSYFQAGAECSIQGRVFLRAGCQVPLSDQSIGGFTDLTAGVGFHLESFSLDYAFQPYGDLGAAHRVSVGYYFEGPKPETTSLVKETPPGFSKSGLPPQSGYTAKGATSQNKAVGLTPAAPDLASGQGLPPPPDIAATPYPPSPGFIKSTSPASPVSQPQALETATALNPGASNPQPQTTATAGTKDSLVVQFDLPDNPAPSGVELEKEGKYREAITAYVETLKQNPRDTATWWALGNLYRKFHRKVYAVQCFSQVLRLQPDSRKLSDWLEQYKSSQP